MNKIKFGWHIPSFPVDGSSAVTFLRQIFNVLSKIQSTFDTAWMDDHLHPWADYITRETDVLECSTTIAHLATAFPHFSTVHDLGTLAGKKGRWVESL